MVGGKGLISAMLSRQFGLASVFACKSIANVTIENCLLPVWLFPKATQSIRFVDYAETQNRLTEMKRREKPRNYARMKIQSFLVCHLRLAIGELQLFLQLVVS